MYNDVLMAGFGGQGVLLIGNLLAQAGMEAGYEVTFMPVYGAEMRGGTANCTVVISSEPIGSPIVEKPIGIIALNEPSLLKFQKAIPENGVLIINSSLIPMTSIQVPHASVKSVEIPVNDIAQELGAPKLLNMVALGAYIKASNVLPLEKVINALSSTISKHYAHLIEGNIKALQAGYNYK